MNLRRTLLRSRSMSGRPEVQAQPRRAVAKAADLKAELPERLGDGALVREAADDTDALAGHDEGEQLAAEARVLDERRLRAERAPQRLNVKMLRAAFAQRAAALLYLAHDFERARLDRKSVV